MDRRISESEDVAESLVSYGVTDDELEEIRKCQESLKQNPTLGEKFAFSGYAGEHWALPCGRFLFIYQYSAVEVRVKGALLSADL